MKRLTCEKCGNTKLFQSYRYLSPELGKEDGTFSKQFGLVSSIVGKCNKCGNKTTVTFDPPKTIEEIRAMD